MSDPSSIESAMKSALEEHGQIDVLVNNAGIAEDNLILRMSRDAWDRVLMTNLTGAFLLIQAVVKGMVRRRYGRIVNVTSVVGLMGNAGQANYAAAKAGLVGLTRSVARELGSRNITCNAVAPGFIATAMTDRMTEQSREGLSGQIPLQRLGVPDDVAGAVAFLASEDAAYVTGAVLNVSGALHVVGKRETRKGKRFIVLRFTFSVSRLEYGRFSLEEGGRMSVDEKVKSIIVEQLGVDANEVTPEASFVDDLGADSLDTVELVMAFEEAFNIEIPDEAAEKIQKVKDAVEYIEKNSPQN